MCFHLLSIKNSGAQDTLPHSKTSPHLEPHVDLIWVHPCMLGLSLVHRKLRRDLAKQILVPLPAHVCRRGSGSGRLPYGGDAESRTLGASHQNAEALIRSCVGQGGGPAFQRRGRGDSERGRMVV